MQAPSKDSFFEWTGTMKMFWFASEPETGFIERDSSNGQISSFQDGIDQLDWNVQLIGDFLPGLAGSTETQPRLMFNMVSIEIAANDLFQIGENEGGRYTDRAK